MSRVVLLLVASSLVLCFGCGTSGPELGRLHGTITRDGQPVQNAVLEFFPNGGGRPSMAQSDADGKYEAFFTYGKPGATLGEHTIRYELLSGMPDSIGTDPDAVNKKIKLTPDTINVVSGKNEIDFKLVPVGN